MKKKAIIILAAAALVASTFVYAPFGQAVDGAKVCGTDNATYDSAAAAEAAGVDVSYEFACVDPANETGLYESKSDVNFAGMLVEIGSTDVPTTIVVRPNGGGADYTVNVTANTVLGQRRDQATSLSDWVPGDQIRVIGKKNENTETIDATVIVNLSIKINANRAANGWITKIDKEAKTITYQWANKEYAFAYDDNTKFVAAGKNPAGVDDLAVNDRIRARLLVRQCLTTPCDPMAKIVVVLRRGAALYMKIRTFTPRATLVRMNSAVVPTTIQVKIEKTPGLRANDVNNLIGAEGSLVTVNITENTNIVRKYFGKATLDEFSVGDDLMIVGRVNDDGTVDAKLLKNNSIWKTSTNGFSAVVAGVDAAQNRLVVVWHPVKYPTAKRLKARLEAADNTVTAQTIGESDLTGSLRARIKNAISERVGQFKREVKYKKVAISRIKHSGLKIGDLIEHADKMKTEVEVTADTRIVVGTNANATISDIKNGDKVRIRGVKTGAGVIVADTIVVVNSLPEIDDTADTPLDVVNEIVDEIDTFDGLSDVTDNTTTATEEEVAAEESAVTTEESGNTEETPAAAETQPASEEQLNSLEPACKAEGETIPVIATPPACCSGLVLIQPREENILGISGICTALCGNGVCDTATESSHNCGKDCQSSSSAE